MTMAGRNTTWNMGDRVIHLTDVIRYLNKRGRRVHRISGRALYKMLDRRLETSRKRIMRADISVPIILVVDRETRRPTVVLDGNHRLAKAVKMRRDIQFRVLYSDEHDLLFGA